LVFLIRVDRLVLLDSLFVLIGNSILSIRLMQSYLVLVKDVLLTGASLGVYLGRALRSIAQKKFPD